MSSWDKAADIEKYALEGVHALFEGNKDRWHDELYSFLESCASPIEVRLAHGMFAQFKSDWVTFWGNWPDTFCGRGLCIPQHELGPYRVDFAILIDWPHGHKTRLAIECDGHDFHERTKAQARRDKKRDRDLMIMGWRVVHFTGSEIHNSLCECLESLEAILEAEVRASFSQVNP